MIESKNTPLSFKEKREKFKFAKPSKFSPKIILGLVGLLVLIIGGVSASFLGNMNQDLRQQADTGDYNTTIGADGGYDPETGRFGWNYETGKAATPDDWTNTDIDIAGTYVHCQEGECKRYVVNIDSTQKAFQEYVNNVNTGKPADSECIQELSGACVAWKPKPTVVPKPTIPPKPAATAKPTATKTTTVEKTEPKCNECYDGRCISWDTSGPRPGNNVCSTTTGTGGADIITQADYNKCISDGNTPGECKTILDNIGKLVPTTRPTAAPTSVPKAAPKTLNDDIYITENDYIKCIGNGNTPGECRTVLDNIGKLEPTAAPTSVPKVLDDNKYITQNDYTKCIDNGNTPGECRTVLDNIGKLEPTAAPKVIVEIKKTDGDKCTPLLGQCENTCGWSSELTGFYCADEEEKIEEPKASPSPVKPSPSPIPTAVPTIAPNLPDWNEACQATCLPGLKCSFGKCIDDCSFEPSDSCERPGLTCEKGGNVVSYGELYSCKDEGWQQISTTKFQFDAWCSNEDKSLYRQALSKVKPGLLSREGTVEINCNPALGIKSEEICAQYRSNLGDDIYMQCQKNGCNCDGDIIHELGHYWADQISEQEGSAPAEIRSFNEAIGCTYEGKGEYSFNKEKAVTSYGNTNCAEAFAELVEIYNREDGPCYLKMSGFDKQLEWMETSPDSPFKGDKNEC